MKARELQTGMCVAGLGVVTAVKVLGSFTRVEFEDGGATDLASEGEVALLTSMPAAALRPGMVVRELAWGDGRVRHALRDGDYAQIEFENGRVQRLGIDETLWVD